MLEPAPTVNQHNETTRPKLTRRQWLKRIAGASAAGSLGIVGYTFFIEPFWLQFVTRDLPLANLPASLDGKRLLQISDVHVGARVRDSYLTRVFQSVSDWQPDFIVLTGDYISCNRGGTAPLEQARRIYSHLKPAKLGTVAILGNHDYGLNWSSKSTADEVSEMLTEQGCQVLRNAATTIGGLRFIGFDDLWSQQFGWKLMSFLPASPAPTIALCHNPDAADLPVWSNYQGWILSGHTHGGQCKPPFLPPPLLPVKNKRYTSGEFDVGDGRQLYINRGVGHLLPARFNVRPEITVFTLRSV